mmetsp:Transcript_17051/g.41506  ORF Transcript_17051/g.41506 Transcript_17051/m.41506 type:complete len:110 (+) Transcript_17051:2482-2811(+)
MYPSSISKDGLLYSQGRRLLESLSNLQVILKTCDNDHCAVGEAYRHKKRKYSATMTSPKSPFSGRQIPCEKIFFIWHSHQGVSLPKISPNNPFGSIILMAKRPQTGSGM